MFVSFQLLQPFLWGGFILRMCFKTRRLAGRAAISSLSLLTVLGSYSRRDSRGRLSLSVEEQLKSIGRSGIILNSVLTANTWKESAMARPWFPPTTLLTRMALLRWELSGTTRR